MRVLYIVLLFFISLIIASEQGVVKMDSFDMEAILEEDKNRQSGTPERYAYDFNVNINFFDIATTESLDNGDTIWRLHLQSDEAIGMKVYFNQFYLPEISRNLRNFKP